MKITWLWAQTVKNFFFFFKSTFLNYILIHYKTFHHSTLHVWSSLLSVKYLMIFRLLLTRNAGLSILSTKDYLHCDTMLEIIDIITLLQSLMILIFVLICSPLTFLLIWIEQCIWLITFPNYLRIYFLWC